MQITGFDNTEVASTAAHRSGNSIGLSGEYLTQYIERIENLETEKRAIADDIRDVYAEAKANGFDPKIMRIIVQQRRIRHEELEALDNMLDLYKHALGMIPSEAA